MNAYLHDNSELSFRGMNILTSHWVTSQPKPQKCKLAVEPNADVHTSLRFKGVAPSYDYTLHERGRSQWSVMHFNHGSFLL